MELVTKDYFLEQYKVHEDEGLIVFRIPTSAGCPDINMNRDGLYKIFEEVEISLDKAFDPDHYRVTCYKKGFLPPRKASIPNWMRNIEPFTYPEPDNSTNKMRELFFSPPVQIYTALKVDREDFSFMYPDSEE